MLTRIEYLRAIRESYIEEIEDLENISNDTGADTDEQRKAFADLEGARADLTAWDASPPGQELKNLESAR